MSKPKSIGAKYPLCHYCGDPVMIKTSRGDHWPIPARYGGIDTVPCCEPCHTAKDRLPIKSWPVEWLKQINTEWSKLSRQQRLMVGKLYDLCLDLSTHKMHDNAIDAFRAGKKIRASHWPDEWSIRRVDTGGAIGIEFDAPEDVQKELHDDKMLDRLILQALLNDLMEVVK